jgi:phosphate transport system substrate-binding protein
MMKTLKLAALAALMTTAAAARGDDSILVTGAGSTFVAPMFSKWTAEYNKLHPNVKLNYQSIGSGAGIKQITERIIDFGATDVAMSDGEMQKAPGVINIPIILGSVVVAYNGVPAGLKLTPDVLADIYLGKIARWNDPRIAAVNAGMKLPELAITVAHRSDGSGTTAVFTDYLSKVSPGWKTAVGSGKSVKWPVGLGGKGNEGVTGTVKQTPGAIGYVELAYAKQNKLDYAALKNADGNFVMPSIESTSEAANGVELPADFRTTLTNAKGKNAYPISSFTFLLIYKEQTDAAKGRAVTQFVWWAIHDGQKLAAPLDYAPLPKAVVARVEGVVKGVTAQGKNILADAK